MGAKRLSAGRRTNVALLLLLALALASGGLTFAIGSGLVRWIVIAHGVAGLAILLLAPWKSVIASRGLRRRRRGSWASIALSILVAVAILSGVGHATGVLRSVGGVSAMQLHVGTALASIPLAVWHVVARRVRPRCTDLSRRAVLRTGALLGGSALVYGAVEGLVAATSLPGGARRSTGSYERGSFRPSEMPVTQWLNDHVPEIDAESWTLTVRWASVEWAWSYQELAAFEDRVRATLDCTGGWYAEQEWDGVFLWRLLPGLGEARSLGIGSSTGYGRRFPLADSANLLLATRVGGAPLSAGHGFPARIVAPGRRGFWWVKWVDAVEVSVTPWWWQSPFPLT
ncbi:MAG: molybdopterin-dependent oxidoreductase [Actinomycetota bacterium]